MKYRYLGKEKLRVSTKFGFVGKEAGALTICGKPGYVKAACHASLKRLGTDYIDLY